MSGQPMHPNPAQLPMLTEVIELLPPTEVGEAGMAKGPRATPPAPGMPGSVPIVTGGLASSQSLPSWTPMTTVVLPTLHEVALPLRTFDLPVLDAVVPELLMPEALQPLPAAAPVEAQPDPELQPAVSSSQPAQPLTGDAPATSTEGVAVPAPALPEISEAQLAQRVLSVVQKQIDGMVEFRLREAMAPILARHSEALILDLREELSSTMADVVARSVAQEMAKLRQR